MNIPVDLRNISALLSVAEVGSFRKAAKELKIGQSAVSRRIQKLEDTLGVSMFERRSQGVRLTVAGADFTSRMRSITSDLDNAVEAAQSHGSAASGQLRLGIIASLSNGALRQVLKAFLNNHDQIKLDINESDRNDLMTCLNHRTLDAVFAAGEVNGEIGDGLTLSRESIFLAVAADHRWSKQSRLRWRDVVEATFVVSSSEPGPEIHDYVIRSVSDLGRSVAVRRHRLCREGIMNLVGLGLGVSLVADHWRGVHYPNVTFVPVGGEDETVPFSITWKPENDNPALRRFISLARIEAKRNGALS